MMTTRVLKNGSSQAIRIPQEPRTKENEYCISAPAGRILMYLLDTNICIYLKNLSIA